jgi:hypothetical protein
MATRRDFLKVGVAATAAGLAPAVSAEVGVISEPIAAPPPVPTPVKLRPYADYVWEWFVSHDGDVYYEAFPTKEEAIEYAQRCDYSIIAECIQQDFRLDVDGWRIIENLNDSNMELIGDGEGIECTADQERDLERMVQQAIEAWVVKHNINITAWSFDGTKNKMLVPERDASVLPPTQCNQE